MAESDFNFGPNFPPGGAPDNARVNNAAFDAEIKKAQELQNATIKELTSTIEELTKKYDELTETNKKLSEGEAYAAKLLRDKIDALTEILETQKKVATSGVSPAPLSNVGVKERTETFTNLTAVIKDYQRSAADLMASGKDLDFDEWFAGYLEQQKLDQLNLKEQKYNGLLLNDIKAVLKQSNTSLSSLSEDELEEIAKRSIDLSVEQKQRELQVIQQNKDIIKLNKQATAQEIANTKQLIESRKFDPTKPIIEKGFKGIGKDLDKIIENTKPRSLLKIVLDLMGPFGAVINFFIKYTIKPLMFSFAVLAGFLLVQHEKFKRLGSLLSGEMFASLGQNIVQVAKVLKYVFKDLPLIIASFIHGWSTKTGELYTGMSRTAKFFGGIAKLSESFFYGWLKLTEFVAKIPNDLARLYKILKTFETEVGGTLRIFGKIYVVVGDVISAISRVISGAGRLLSPFVSAGNGILRISSAITQTVRSSLLPVINFFSSGLGRIIIAIDKLGGGLGVVLRAGLSFGRWLGGIFSPITAIITVLSDLPVFFKRLFTGNPYTIAKSIMALLVQISGLVLATIFGGPLGTMFAALTLKLENILKWFDPIFDFLIYAGGLILTTVWSLYTDFVEPAIEMIVKVVGAVLNLAFHLLKPVFKFGQFLIILLAPLFLLVTYVFKLFGKVFSLIGELADAITTYFIDPIFKILDDIMFKFIQPLYDWLADSIVGKMLGMETKEDREAREAKERKAAEKSKKAAAQAEEKSKFSFSSFTTDAGKKIGEGYNTTKQVVTQTVDRSIDVAKMLMTRLDSSLFGLTDQFKQLSDYLKNLLTSVSVSLTDMSRALNTQISNNVSGFANAIQQRIDTPENRNILAAATTPITYSTAKTMTPTFQGAKLSQPDMRAFVEGMRSLSDKATSAGTINNQQTTVVNNTSGSQVMTMPSNSERTVNQINNSVRPAG